MLSPFAIILSNTLPLLIVVMTGKGGVGKTLLSLAIADLFALAGLPLDIVQLDDQRRLAMALGCEVVSLDLAVLKRARKDPSALTRVFAPLYGLIEAMGRTGRSILLDVGATQQHALFDYAVLTELAGDLAEFGIAGRVLVPTVTDPESLRQAAQQLRRTADVFPSLDRVVVLNERDGDFSALPRESQAGELYAREIAPLFGQIAAIRMPRIEANSWGYFERQNARLIDVIGWDVPTTMAVSGLPRPEAKLARGDVAAFFATIETELARVLPIGEARHG
jgi:hypothetical protein